jgi:hypothetical protein
MRNFWIAVLGGAAILCCTLAPANEPVHAAGSPCEIDGVDRIVAVGDVHGAYDRFVEILRQAGIIDARLHWTGGRAHLVQTGDIVDRGADSRKALDLLRALEDEARRAGGAVHPLLGNHEVARMLGDDRYMTPGEAAAFVTPKSEQLRNAFISQAPKDKRDELAKTTPVGWVEMAQAFSRRGDYGRWLRTHDTVIRINGIVFLHGGISPRIAGRTCNDINTQVRREMTDDEDKTRANALASLAASVDGPLWYRGLAQEPDTFEPQFDEILRGQHARAIVVGHTVIPGGRVGVRFSGRLFEIDTGMQPAYVPDGRASALEIQGGHVTAIYTDRRDVVGTLEDVASPSRSR